MNKRIKEYSEALKAYIEACKAEVLSKVEVRKTRCRLVLARTALRDMESEIQDDILRLDLLCPTNQ